MTGLPDTLAAAPEAERRAQQKFVCPACGGEAQWHPGKQALLCAYCGTESPYRIEAAGEILEHDLVAALKAVPQSARGLQQARRQVRCQHCQAISFFSAEQQGRRCDFCGSTALLPFDEGLDVIRPQSLLPFKVAEPDARNRLRQWYGSRFWAPNALKHRALTDTLQGVYLPYWTFDAHGAAHYTAEAGTYYRDSQNKQQVRWRPVSGQVAHRFDDTLVCGSRGVHPALMRAIEPFPTTSELQAYDASYLSGWTVERYALDLAGAAQQGRERMLQGLRQLCAQDIAADTHRNLQLDARFDEQTFKHVLLPVWLVSYQYGAKTFQAVVNGYSGQVAGEYPKSWVKIALAVLLGLVLLAVFASLDQ
ncbi:zinc ribbon domain-containing protein [Hydrogenophaga sp. D2P1]|uniref:Zinc ribbon domain-containing protein n=1 Tax=Hydrogenophaga aromaticivorans TaxID=2610898 RepID=A0A7Y8KZ63_9BURK|nr:zinc ribbon domain-containing protein [Hydrogenophaga aromaticivorans]NWF47352.1 zinc ribbon domain-containing protein [Hydrogenophaga aromaticivorans]